MKLEKGVKDHPAFAEEAIRVITKMPKWKPGKMNGKNVAVKMTIPVKFVLK
ncbi:MAG: hypothetical protein Fur0041_06360 [Bacteroidia bacterium]